MENTKYFDTHNIHEKRDYSQCFWGKPTSNIDWCEENYAVTYLVAEFWNTISSFVLAFYGFYGLYTALKFRLDWAVKFCHLALVFVGLGSVAFHATLLFEYQLSDELPMIYGDIALLYLILADPVHKPVFTKILPVLCGITSVVISVLMWNNPENPLVLQLGYSTQVTLIIARSSYLAYTHKKIRNMFVAALAAYATATACWLIDQFFCGWVQFLQLHAWWHALAGLGTFLFILFGTQYRLNVVFNRKTATVYPVPGFLAYVYPIDYYKKAQD